MTYPFEYETTVWNEIDGIAENMQGVTFADSYAEAMKNIEDYYGDTIIDIKLFCLDDSTVYEFNNTREELWHGMFKINNVKKWE